MKNTFLAAFAAIFLASTASAAEVTGDVEVTVDGDAVATTELTLDFVAYEDIASASITLDENGVDGYSIGTMVSGVTLSYGDQGDIMLGGGLNVVGGSTLADPVSADTSLIVGIAEAQVLVGFGADLSEVENLQLSYDMGMVAASLDYNVDSEELTVVGAGSYTFGTVDTGLLVSYDDTFAYELTAGAYGFVAYVNGDEDEMLQNVGAGYETDFAGLTVFAEAEYNLDSEEVTPAVGVSLSF